MDIEIRINRAKDGKPYITVAGSYKDGDHGYATQMLAEAYRAVVDELGLSTQKSPRSGGGVQNDEEESRNSFEVLPD